MLTTPEISKNDDVFPGEKWFCYWKTSASLWDSKLSDYAVGSEVYVPINWSVHSPNPDQYDFGDIKPETDLAKLHEIANRLSIRLVFLISYSPMPYISNSGIPGFLAQTNSLDKNGLQVFNFDRNSKLNLAYSFFNPRVYQYFSKFLKVLNKYFVTRAISSEVVGIENYFYHDRKATSFFEDHSSEFDAGFHRYLNQIETEDPKKFEQIKLNKKLEIIETQAYRDLIKNLYVQSLEEIMGTNLIGFRKYLFLGASIEESIENSMDKWESKTNFFEGLFFSVFNNFVPSSALLGDDLRDDCLDEALKNIVKKDFIELGLEDNDLDEKTGFEPLSLFNIFIDDISSFIKLGLDEFFSKDFRWTYRINSPLPEEIDDRVYIICNDRVSDERFNYSLKVFMNGGTVFLDEDSLNDDQVRKLTIFLAENSIESQTVRLGVIVKSSSLGQGSLFRFSSSELLTIGTSKQYEFWNKILSTLEIKHPVCHSDDGIYFMWMRRFSNAYELDYEEIRRVSIYNPSNYKRKFQVKGHKNLAFLKSIDDRNTSLNSSNKSIDVELKPKGSISLDFGLFD